MLRFSLLILCMTAVVVAFRAAAAASPRSGCSAPEYRQFDYWLGDWDTYDPGDSGTSVARTHVDPIAAGCGVHELYEQTDGLIGDSILSFDPVRKVWQQTWITNRGSLMHITGVFKDRVVTLQGEMHVGDGRTLLQRITWKPEGDGVRESSVMSRDGGKTWEPSFDVLFKRHH